MMVGTKEYQIDELQIKLNQIKITISPELRSLFSLGSVKII